MQGGAFEVLAAKPEKSSTPTVAPHSFMPQPQLRNLPLRLTPADLGLPLYVRCEQVKFECMKPAKMSGDQPVHRHFGHVMLDYRWISGATMLAYPINNAMVIFAF